MNSLDIAFTVRELSMFLKEGFIDNIYIVKEGFILIRVRAGSRYDVLVDPPRRIHTTEIEYEKPRMPPSLCMMLRKHLVGGKVKDISQHRFERIIVFSIATRRGDYKLYVELFREGNLILVGPDGRIVCALRRKRMKDRAIVHGAEFKLPPAVGLDPFSDPIDEIVENFPSEDMPIAKWMTIKLGLPSPYLDEILARIGVEKDKMLKDLPRSTPVAIVETLKNMVSSAGDPPFRSYIYLSSDDTPIDLSPFKLEIYRDLRYEEYPSFNAALDSYFQRLASSEGYGEVVKARRKQAAIILKSMRKIESRIAKLESKASEYKCIADTLSVYIDQLRAVASFILESKKSGMGEEDIVGEASIMASNLGLKLVDIDFSSGLFRIEIDGCKAELSFTKNIYESISRYYKMYKRRYGEIESLRLKLEELKRDLSKLESRVVGYPQVKVRRRMWYEKFNFFNSSEGFLVLAGRDASTNELLIKKYTDPSDIVFHADIHGAPFVVVKTEGRSPSQTTIMEAAIFAASYSQAWKDGFSSMDVFYVSPSQLSKSPPPGQYLPKGAFRIIGSRNYIRSVPLELAIGLIISGDSRVELIVAPVSAVKARTDIYIKIAPGSIPKNKLIDLIKAKIIEKARKVFEGGLPVNIFEDLQHRLPAGGGRIVDE